MLKKRLDLEAFRSVICYYINRCLLKYLLLTRHWIRSTLSFEPYHGKKVGKFPPDKDAEAGYAGHTFHLSTWEAEAVGSL